ncbi:MAG: PLP-dependent aminotransferase family protein [Faecalibacterium sp.]|jgi:GntR family transcriptional regulator/MocR family aminotransferase|nr:PLP-dependent aminotransferase family protein [Faecalibacterium sp.]
MQQIILSAGETAGKPLYRQLYEALSAQIAQGQLPAGTRLPGKRTLAAELGISVHTVDTAYQMLAAEGYLESRARSGFTVLAFSDVLPAAMQGHMPRAEAAFAAPPDAKGSVLPAEKPCARQPEAKPCRFSLAATGADTRLFPFRTWARLQKELLYSAPELLAHGDGRGDANLRAALAAYLAAYRGVQCTPGQIVVGAGLEYLLGLLAPLLGGVCAVEDPGYSATRAILENSGLLCRAVPVDGEGLSLTALQASGANVCYVTPSHQFPTGVTMPAPRRAALLAWAAEAPGRRYILEDDYDSEFRFDLRPLPSLQGMAGADGPVIYLSTVSKSLAPSIRIAYMVLPENLLAAWEARYGSYSSTVSRFEQQTFCRFLEQGCFTRHLARMRNTCKARRDALAAALTEAFGPGKVQLSGLHTGLHLLLTLPGGPGEAEMVRRAAAHGVHLSGLSAYYTEKSACPPNTVLLGYGSLLPEDAAEAAGALASAWSAASVSSLNS